MIFYLVVVGMMRNCLIILLNVDFCVYVFNESLFVIEGLNMMDEVLLA